MMNKFILIALLVCSWVFIAFPANKAHAVDIFSRTCSNSSFQNKAKDNSVCADANQQKGTSQNPIISIITSAIRVISYIIGVAAIIGILIGSIRLINSSGDASAISDARRAIYFSIIGVVVALMAQLLVVFVLSKL